MHILFGSLILFMLLGFPIAFTIGFSTFAWIILESPFSVMIIPQRFFAGMNGWSLLAIPLFLLVGNLMNATDITERLVNLVNAIIGHITGGLALANVGVSMIFAGISGTALADTASVGAIMIPAMKKSGYDSKFSAAVTVSSSIVGPIIPPSMPMILTGSILGISIGRLFIGGALPGLLLGFALMVTTYYISLKKDLPKEEKKSVSQVFDDFKLAFFALMIPIVMVGGIVFGVFTPTEAGAIGVLSTLIIGGFIYKTINFKNLYNSFVETAVAAASVLILVGFANVFAWILSVERVPQMISSWMLSITNNETILLLLIIG
ncbi:MAG: TRAP transporter large permease, partial [Halanaerobiales bacterium]